MWSQKFEKENHGHNHRSSWWTKNFFVLNFFGGINFVGHSFKGILCFALVEKGNFWSPCGPILFCHENVALYEYWILYSLIFLNWTLKLKFIVFFPMFILAQILATSIISIE
jgi:hypothetical protein